MNSVKQMVDNNKQVRFLRFERGELWYVTECGFEFPIPSEDLQGAAFCAQDKALLFMRWIKRHMGENNKQVHFVRFEHGELWYATESGFEFPIPYEDLQGATFCAQGKESLFTRWIMRHINHIEMARSEIPA